MPVVKAETYDTFQKHINAVAAYALAIDHAKEDILVGKPLIFNGHDAMVTQIYERGILCLIFHKYGNHNEFFTWDDVIRKFGFYRPEKEYDYDNA